MFKANSVYDQVGPLVPYWVSLLSPTISGCQSAIEMLFCSNGTLRPFSSSFSCSSTRIFRGARPCPDYFARHRHQFRIIGWMTEIGNTVPILSAAVWEDNSVQRAFQQPIRPMTQQICDIHEDWRESIIFCSRR